MKWASLVSRSTAPILAVSILMAFAMPVGAQLPGMEVYLTDSRLAPGMIFEVIEWPPYDPAPYPRPVYTGHAGGISALAVGADGWVYFADANRNEIRRTNGTVEYEIYTHHTYVRDLAFDSRGRLFFSTATGAGGDGSIYRLDVVRRRAIPYRRIALSRVDGFWAGHFAFDRRDSLYLSSGNIVPASLYQETGRGLVKLFTWREPITGFVVIDPEHVLFTNHRQRLYRLESGDLEVLVEHGRFTWMNDVAITPEPAGTSCTISGTLHGASALWPVTSVQARGPDFIWRSAGSAPVNADGTYSLSGLPPGLYRVSTDIRPDTAVSFDPDFRMVRCTGAVTGIDFTAPGQ